ncbi:MAG: hypothetical protein EOP06_30880 [Proteobacteria bacterium]|nr:MAG: hypothetical protein EOP06_30880 [Pseudomonadota bacterium]
MKKNKCLFILLILLACVLQPLQLFAGNEGANAGDEVGLEFQASYYGAFTDIDNFFLRYGIQPACKEPSPCFTDLRH